MQEQPQGSCGIPSFFVLCPPWYAIDQFNHIVLGVNPYQFVINFYHTMPALNSRVCGFVSTNQLNKMAADRALIKAARGLITCQATEETGGNDTYDAL